MKSSIKFALAGVLLMTGVGFGQTVTGSGTTATVPVFTGTSKLGNSLITQSSGNVGISMSSPVFPLDVGGGGRFNWRSEVNAPGFSDVSNPAFLVRDTEDPGTSMVPYASISANASGTNITPSICGANAGATSNCGYFGLYFAGSGSSNNYLTMGITGHDHLLNVFQNGYVGIGTQTPHSALEVTGNITVGGTGAGIFFPGNSTPQTVPWTGSLFGQDYADSVDVTGDRSEYEPGDVLVIDTSSPRHFSKSTKPYSTLAAGVYSTKPGAVGRRNHDASAEAAEVPLAMAGIVPTKVSAENGPIRQGDLLVTSSTPGFAMKGKGRKLQSGVVLGKALADLPSGTGIIEVLVSLQ